MSKYVIEFDKEQLLEYDKDTDTYFRTLYKAKGFNALVFDKNGLDKLTPLDKELEEAYQKGVHEGSLDVKERVEGAYQKGYEAGQHEATTLEYQQGLDDAWEMAKRIVLIKTDANCPYFTIDEFIRRGRDPGKVQQLLPRKLGRSLQGFRRRAWRSLARNR